jgi:hypothetical protein
MSTGKPWEPTGGPRGIPCEQVRRPDIPGAHMSRKRKEEYGRTETDGDYPAPVSTMGCARIHRLIMV